MTTSAPPTRILFCSYAFHPSIGGIEAASLFLVDKLIRRGLHVEVVTNSPAKPGEVYDYGYPVHRRPDRKTLIALFRRSDLIFHNNISLNYAWPLMLVRRPLVIAGHTPIDATIEKSAIKRQIKIMLMRTATCISVSKFLADSFPVKSRVIYNALRKNIFHLDPTIERNQPLLFVGRLVEAKGVDILLQALHLLRRKGIAPATTVVGSGPEEQRLKALATKLDLNAQVSFIGPRQSEQIAQIMNQHEILVMPSRRKPAEALPIVVLESIACGNVLVAAAQGGLPEAVGPCGITFECENPQALADALEHVLASRKLRDELRAPASDFLKQFGEETIVEQYLEVFSQAMPGGKLSYG
jgi:glycosyltransferase involved in cell wall biosynthesis